MFYLKSIANKKISLGESQLILSIGVRRTSLEVVDRFDL